MLLMRSLHKVRAFTLIELVTVMIIVAILSVTAAGKFFSSSGYEEYTYRSQAISLIRAVQLRAMQQVIVDASTCHQVTVTNKQISDDCGHVILVENNHQVTFSSNSGSSFTFDHQGRVGANINITITGAEALILTIESEGFIHAL